MARNAPWKRAVSDTTSWRQDQALESTIFIVKEVGPTGFLLKTEGENKPVKVLIGDPHSCTCMTFRNERNDLCKHICWLLLKKFRVAREDPVSWQLGLVEREIESLLVVEQDRRRLIRNRPETPRKPTAASTAKDGRPVLERRDITEEDSCPICMEELLTKREPVTYCRYSCANSIHIKCMKIWADHQTSSGEKVVKCPFCREDFGPMDHLLQEYRNTAVPGLQHRSRTVEHHGTQCRVCSQNPIQGKCYRCSRCNEFYLCQRCFNTSAHMEHPFEFRLVPTQRWRPAQRVVTNGLAIPSTVVANLANRDIGDADYDLLLQLDNAAGAELSEIPESFINKLPLERVRIGSRYLAPGEQCCICLHAYNIGDYIRRLPCKHKFHKDCITEWLLHQHPTCPIDGMVVWSRLTATEGSQARPRGQRRAAAAVRQAQHVQPVDTEPVLEIPGFGIGRRDDHHSTTSELPVHEDGPSLRSRSAVSEPPPSSDTIDNRQPSSNDFSLNLAQILLTDAIEGSAESHSADARRRYIRTQISSSEPPNNDLANLLPAASHGAPRAQARADNRRQVPTVQPLTSASHSDTESENARRRRRNMELAVNMRWMGGINEAVSTPSISTTQPAGVSSLYLGNPITEKHRFSEGPPKRIRNSGRSISTNRPQVAPSQLPSQLAIGRTNGDIREARSATHSKPTIRRQSHQSKCSTIPASSGNSRPALLELTGTAFEGSMPL